MGFFYFLKQKKFYFHLAIAFVAALLLLLIVLKILKFYTLHGEAIPVPDYIGMTEEEILDNPRNQIFEFIITDSIFDPKKEKGTIFQQNPLPDSKVKRGRKIYLTIVAKGQQMVSMPNLVDLSLRQALLRLETNNLKVNSLEYIPDFAQNAVLAQLIYGDTILPGSLIPIETKINLVLGKGYNQRQYNVPFLIGMKRSDAIKRIHGSSFNLGKEIFLDLDSLNARVFFQFPEWDSKEFLNPGDFINLEYRSDLYFNFDEYLESLLPDTLSIDSMMAEPVFDTIFEFN